MKAVTAPLPEAGPATPAGILTRMTPDIVSAAATASATEISVTAAAIVKRM